MDLGRFQLGHFVPVMFDALDANNAPSWPTATPTIKTFSETDLTTAVETIRPGARDIHRQTGLFYYPLRLSSSYSANKVYFVSSSWAIGGSTYRQLDQFRIEPGGDADGAVIGGIFIARPEAGVVAYIVDSGKLKTARNPR